MNTLDYYLGLNYEVHLRKLTAEEGGGWVAQIPLLPGCMSDGETAEEALLNLDDAKRSWIETCLSLGQEVPVPTADTFSGQLRVRMPKSLHKALSEKARDENVSLNQFIVYQLARGIGYRSP